MENKGVETLHGDYERLQDQWQRCRDTAEGSDSVKHRKGKYLPPLDSHKKDGGGPKYYEYLLRALFYGAMGRTVAGLSGAIFQKAPGINNLTDKVKEDLKDVTLTGEPLEQFALQVTKEYLITGRYGILVDMASEEATKPRPYWVGYRAEDIVNWRFTRMGGDQELSLVVLREYIEDPEAKDEFSVDQVIQYRVLRLNNIESKTGTYYTQQLYIEQESKEGNKRKEFVGGPVLMPMRRGAALDFIPFALPWAVNQPPLVDLADVNLSHYRGSADLKHGLHFTALPTPWVSGQTGEGSKALAIGSGVAWSLEKDGKAGMLEFTGSGLGAIRTDLEDMQNLMATLGARLLQPPPKYAETALSVSMRHSSDYASLRTLAHIVEQQLTFALQIHSWWLGTETLVAEVKAEIQLNKVFFDQSITADELRALLLALQGNAISYKTFYARLQNTGWNREGISPEQELTEILAQHPELGHPPAKPGTVDSKTGLPSEKDKKAPKADEESEE